MLSSRIPKHSQRGIGIIEVLVAAAILALTVGVGIYGASRWLKTTNSSTMRSQGSQINIAAMELASFNPDASWVAERLPSTKAGNTNFYISSLKSDVVGNSTATRTRIATAWEDADDDGASVLPSLNFEAAVMTQAWNQTVSELASFTPSHDPDHWLYHSDREAEPETEPNPEPEPQPEPDPEPEPEPQPEPEPEPEPETELSPWVAKVQFSTVVYSGQGAYSFGVSFADGQSCSSPPQGQTGAFSCTTSTSLATINASISQVTVSGNNQICAVTPSVLGGGSSGVSLSPDSATLSVSITMAKRNGRGSGCP